MYLRISKNLFLRASNLFHVSSKKLIGRESNEIIPRFRDGNVSFIKTSSHSSSPSKNIHASTSTFRRFFCTKTQPHSTPQQRRETRPDSIPRQAIIMDGRAIAAQIEAEVSEEIARLLTAGAVLRRPPHLSVIVVGEDPASRTYVDNKIKACQRSGITSDTVRLPRSVPEAALLDKIHRLNVDDGVDGILVQLPVSPHIDERRVCNAVTPAKDVDGFHVVNMGRLNGNIDSLFPATPQGVVELIRRFEIPTFGKHAVVVGRSKNVGLPTAMLLHSDGALAYPGLDATVTICHRYTPPDMLKAMTSMADILVVAVGLPRFITADMVKPGAAVLDVGINVCYDSSSSLGKRKLIGDVDFDAVATKAGHITPVPGGIGPMTVAMLLKNTLKAAKRDVDFSA